MSPAQHTRLVLAEYREIGVPFTQAWASAMRTLPRRDWDYKLWKTALLWARPAYEAAYHDAAYHVQHVDLERTELRRGAHPDASPDEPQIENPHLGELTPA